MESLPELLFRTPSDLIAAIVQDADSGQILMMAWMNQEALRLTMETKRATYWSRSRKEIWVKGATSGNTQEVESIALDCDGDALLLKVKQTGVACHTGEVSCFHRHLDIKESL
jgi:phosphoribosyl-AMP cyclohydrolase